MPVVQAGQLRLHGCARAQQVSSALGQGAQLWQHFRSILAAAGQKHGNVGAGSVEHGWFLRRHATVGQYNRAATADCFAKQARLLLCNRQQEAVCRALHSFLMCPRAAAAAATAAPAVALYQPAGA
jgi:hypothetical protein